MKKNLIFAMSLSLLFACNQPKNTGLDITDMDLSADPTQDFDAYANGGWKAKNEIPADKGRYTSFDELADKARDQVKVLVKEISEGTHPEGSNAQKIQAIYNMGMDVETINNQKYDGIKPFLAQIESISTLDELRTAVARLHTFGAGSMFGFGVGADFMNSSMNMAMLAQGGLGMPDRDYYLDEGERADEIRAAYRQYMVTVLELTDIADANDVAQKIIDIETRLAKASLTRLECRNITNMYHVKTTTELETAYPNLDFTSYFTNLGIEDPERVNVMMPLFFDELNTMLTDVSLADWKSYLTWNIIDGTTSYLSDAYVNAAFEFSGKVLSGTEEMKPRWERVQGLTSGLLGEALGQEYVKHYFSEASKTRMVNLIENLRLALGDRIAQVEWMSDETKENAYAKLATINVKVGYPDKWTDYSSMELKDDFYVMNVLRAYAFHTQENLDELNKPVDKSKWGMTPQTVNAYYNPMNNEIVFPAAILQPPFFYADADDALNYGAIGVVIGHEMTHGFDDKGRSFDKEGNMKDWWQEIDAEKFDQRADVLVKQFDEFVVLDTLHADGKLSLGENIADLGGLNISYTAFQKTLTGDETEIDGFTPNQRFFLAYAHVWAGNVRDKEAIRRTKEDVHSLGHFRVIGPLRNMPEFYQAFDVKAGDDMYLAPEDRAVIW